VKAAGLAISSKAPKKYGLQAVIGISPVGCLTEPLAPSIPEWLLIFLGLGTSPKTPQQLFFSLAFTARDHKIYTIT
jgi:hypothetical protein